VDPNNTLFTDVDGVLFDRKVTDIIQFPKGWVGEYIAPDSLKYIYNTFRYCHKLTSITIPSSLTMITSKMFLGCNMLTAININVNTYDLNSVDGVFFSSRGLHEYPEGKTGMYVIPKGTNLIELNAFKGCSGLTGVTIPSSVLSIKSDAFYGCNNLKVVSYLGYTDPFSFSDYSSGRSAFGNCDGLRKLCVPKGYIGTAGGFCGRTDFCITDSCEDFHLDENHCYEETCWFGDPLMKKRKNATEWDERLHACVDFVCNNDVGPLAWSMCNSTEKQRRMCANDGCLPFDSQTRVEIDINDGYFAGDVNMSKLHVTMKSYSGNDKVEVGLELNDRAYVVRVIVLVDDDKTGQNIIKAVEDLDKSEKCQSGVLCEAKMVRLVTMSLDLSGTNSNHGSTASFIIMMFVLVMIIVMKNDQ